MSVILLPSLSDPLLTQAEVAAKQAGTCTKQCSSSARQAKFEKMGEYNGELGYFIKVWFIDSTQNGNGWQVTKESISPGLKTALEPRFQTGNMGRLPGFRNTAPLICMPDWQDPSQRGHPSPYSPDMITEQGPYRVGDFIGVGTEDDSNSGIRYGWVVIKITDGTTIEEIDSGRINFFSPSILPKHTVNGVDTSWIINHLAVVDEPAYGAKAHILGRCSGGSQCVHMLTHQASLSLHVQAIHRQGWGKTLIGGREVVRWITVNGAHVPVFAGQSDKDATEDFLAKKEDKKDDKPKEKPKDTPKELPKKKNVTADKTPLYTKGEHSEFERLQKALDIDPNKALKKLPRLLEIFKRDGTLSDAAYAHTQEILQKFKDSKQSSKDFDSWTNTDKNTKFTTRGFISKTSAKRFEKAWNTLPENARAHVKKLELTQIQGMGRAGSWSPANSTMKLSYYEHVNRYADGDDILKHTVFHEGNHARWQHVRTAEQKQKWKKRADSENLYGATDYALGFFATASTYKRNLEHNIKQAEIREKEGRSSTAKYHREKAQEYKEIISDARDLAYNELHSEVYSWIKAPSATKGIGVGPVAMAKAVKAYKEIFGED